MQMVTKLRQHAAREVLEARILPIIRLALERRAIAS
jgi:hypothetical protein